MPVDYSDVTLVVFIVLLVAVCVGYLAMTRTRKRKWNPMTMSERDDPNTKYLDSGWR